MAESFSFSESDIEHIISNTNNLVLGITKVMSVFFHKKINKVKAIVVNNPFATHDFEEFYVEEKTLLLIEKLRNEDIDYAWYSEDEIPLSTETLKIKQLDAFEENNRQHILMITLKNESDNKNDLIYYYFNRNLSNFKPTDAEITLDKGNKIAIGSLMFKMANMMAETCRNDRRALHFHNLNFWSIINKLKDEVSTNKERNDNHYNALINFANDTLKEISARSNQYIFELSDNAKAKLSEYHGEFKSLNKILKNAANLAANMNIDLSGQTVMIEGLHLDFGESIQTGIQPSVRMDESKYDKTILLLDKLEDAAVIVKKNNLPVTGSNVGKACKKPISAPAISDALDKHRSKIKKVIEKYKDRWPIIRNEFKPLINVLIAKQSDEELLRKQA